MSFCPSAVCLPSSLKGCLVLDGEHEDPARRHEREEEVERLVLVRAVRVEEALGHHRAGHLVQHQHVDAAPGTRVGVLKDLGEKKRGRDVTRGKVGCGCPKRG